MTRNEALQLSETNRVQWNIPAELAFSSIVREIVEFSTDRDSPVPPRDRIAWVVQFAGDTGFVRVILDESTGTLLEVVRNT